MVDRINQETPGIAVELTEAAGTMSSRSRANAPQNAPQGPYVFDQHGGVGESSSSLYLTPGLVNLSAAKVATLTYPRTLQAMLPSIDKRSERVQVSREVLGAATASHIGH